MADYPDDARIDLSGEKEGIVLEAGTVSPGGKAVSASWRKEKADQNINATFPASDHWETASLSFTPRASGKIILALSGPYVKGKDGQLQQVWVAFDDLNADGAQIENGSFEEQGGNGSLKAWYRFPSSGPDTAFISDEGASDGRNSAMVWHNGRYQQVMAVEADREVTLTFKIKTVEKAQQ